MVCWSLSLLTPGVMQCGMLFIVCTDPWGEGTVWYVGHCRPTDPWGEGTVWMLVIVFADP